MKIGLQLYSVRQALSENLPETLRAVKDMGYDFVEIAGGRYGLNGKEMNAAVKGAGLTCISVHSSPSLYQADKEDVASYQKALDAPFVAVPVSLGREEAYLSHWDETLALYREMGEFWKARSVQLLYHNHDFEFKKMGDKVILPTLLSQLKDTLLPEPDLCWISYAGISPASFLADYRGRVPVVHLKDYTCTNLPQKPIWRLLEEGGEKPEKKSEAGFDYRPVGYGVELWDAVIEALEKAGSEYLIVEQDASPDPMAAAFQSRTFLKETFGL